jgi:ribosomal protein S18 acetylase RimI-like enzyme
VYPFEYRPIRESDVPQLAVIRAADWGDEEYWRQRISQYLSGDANPKDAQCSRTSFVCAHGQDLVGFIAGHLTRRFNCNGELQWISVRQDYRRRGIGAKLLGCMAEWFVAHHAYRICVDVEPSNEAARRFYRRYGAENLKPHWMVWADINVLSEDETHSRRRDFR